MLRVYITEFDEYLQCVMYRCAVEENKKENLNQQRGKIRPRKQEEKGNMAGRTRRGRRIGRWED